MPWSVSRCLGPGILGCGQEPRAPGVGCPAPVSGALRQCQAPRGYPFCGIQNFGISVHSLLQSHSQESDGKTDGTRRFSASNMSRTLFPVLADCSGGTSKAVLTISCRTKNFGISEHSLLLSHSQESHGKTDGTRRFSASNRSRTRFPMLADCNGGISKVVPTPSCRTQNFGISVHLLLLSHSQESHGKTEGTQRFSASNRSRTLFPGLAECSGGI